jgi:hypothetical protein
VLQHTFNCQVQQADVVDKSLRNALIRDSTAEEFFDDFIGGHLVNRRRIVKPNPHGHMIMHNHHILLSTPLKNAGASPGDNPQLFAPSTLPATVHNAKL